MHGVENEFMVRYLKGSTARLLCRHHRAPRADCFLGTEASDLSECGLFPEGPDAFAQIGAAGFERSINRLGKNSWAQPLVILYTCYTIFAPIIR
jgi:hypothetical protein